MNPQERAPLKLLIRQLSCRVGCAVGFLIYPATCVRLFQRTLKLNGVTGAESRTAPEYSNVTGPERLRQAVTDRRGTVPDLLQRPQATSPPRVRIEGLLERESSCAHEWTATGIAH